MNKLLKISTIALLSINANIAHSASLVASYNFNNSLTANEASAPTLVSIDPLGLNTFETATVHGQNQTVFHWSGNGVSPDKNAGLSLDTTGLLTYNSYSVAMTFEFDALAQFGGGWRRVIDTENRQSDNGFYVSPGNQLQTVQGTDSGNNALASGSTLFTTPGFHDILFTVSPNGSQQTVKVYLDGNLELSTATDTFNLDNTHNAGNLLYFFVDNIAAGSQQEYANGRIASLEIYDGEVMPSAVPEPESYALMLAGLITIGFIRRRKAQQA